MDAQRRIPFSDVFTHFADFASSFIEKHPYGEKFSFTDLESAVPGLYAASRILHGLRDIVVIHGRDETDSVVFDVTPGNVWALPPFPSLRTAAKEDYVDVRLMKQLNKATQSRCFGYPGKDFEFMLGPMKRKCYEDAWFVRAYSREGGTVDTVNYNDLLRLGICRNMCITTDMFMDSIVPLVMKFNNGDIDPVLENRLKTDEKFLDYLWQEFSDGSGRTGLFIYKDNRYYHPEIFGENPVFAKAIRSFFGFQRRKQVVQPRKTEQAHRNMWELKIDFDLDRSGARHYDAFKGKRTVTSHHPYERITTPGCMVRDQRHVSKVYVFGLPKEFDNGAREMFCHLGFKKLKLDPGAHQLQPYYEYGRGPSRAEELDVCVDFIVGYPDYSHVLEADLIALCESAYHCYTPELFFSGHKKKNFVMLCMTRAHSHGQYQIYPDPGKISQLNGTRLLPEEGAPATLFMAAYIPEYLKKIHQVKLHERT